ncbi:proline dehydrogenase family protein [Pseudodesulfovibrio tunisiensis]|uniref:proline dehydrogenase family protein n=1 Tax=Pseudodesulfovibrio tunisiensis TaxID=463192 RepID=UPI001FB4B7A1|nr:proline dehydrogenase family protein [Pseudodesulfovibrio tunisiensis]
MTVETAGLDSRIIARGKEFFKAISGESPSIFNKGWWTGKVMDWAMQNEDFKVQMFRFVDVLPYLNTSESLSRHIEEYFAGEDADNIPDVLKWGATKTKIGGGLVARVLNRTIRSNIESMGRQFIIGEDGKEAVKGIRKLRKDGFAFVLDLLGEATVSEEEAQAYLDGYMEILDAVDAEFRKWPPLDGGVDDLDWGHAPGINVAVKPSAFYSQSKPVDPEGTVQGMMDRIEPVYRKVMDMGGFMCIDMEQLKYKEPTIELYKRLRTKYPDYPHLGIVFQAYLRSTPDDVASFLAWAREEKLPVSIRLVKGAYWDYETVLAKQNGWEIPVWTHKPESDICYERVANLILENHEICHFACASHNIRTISAVMEMARSLNVPEERYEFQVLYGMAEPVRKGLKKVAKRVRLYCPYGDLIPGMAYLVRRLLENTANESFLKLTFADEADMDRLLENPEETLKRQLSVSCRKSSGRKDVLGPFRNFPPADFTISSQREGFVEGLKQVRAGLGRKYPLFIGGREVETSDTIASCNPADPSEIIGTVCQAGVNEVDEAVRVASKAYLTWRDVPPRERAEYLLKASQYLKDNIHELSSLQVLEVGKQWDQAQGDVAEAIDFLEYYAREMIRLGEPRRMGNAPGEMSRLFYQGKGVAAVIAPWNFPLAISMGMTSAAIVCGCPVVYKPAGLSSVVGYGLVQAFRAAGLPDGVFNYCPGRGSVMGDYLVEHPDVAVIAFTGSMEVGLRIQEKAAKVQPGQQQCKRVIAEMGGKNAIIIDDDADLDEAVLGVLYSAFGFQGQKCSACSRVIVLDAIYDRFVHRLREAAGSIRLGPAEDPANYMGPVVDKGAQENVLRYGRIAEEEGTVLVRREVSDELRVSGCYVPLLIVENILPGHRIAQEEVFGPVLSVMRAKDMDQALEWANSTRFALTGAIYSRSPNNLERASREFRVGNLYLNKPSVGALVERHAFGGFKMSGVGSKSGGPDYLLQFLDPRLVCENTIRRGFAPIEDSDDWIR